MDNPIQNSALWAAYGDALGFISEMSDARGLRRRIGSDRVVKTLPWTRLVGGKFGTFAQFPAGTYSDDTQLRLATSRCIDSAGHFDVEAFSKIELPVWLSYALGAGVGSKAAASNLTKPNVAWFSNFFVDGKANYINSGGNGAAMRIQPIVWIAQGKPILGDWLKDILRNTICTHGHPRGIGGAVFHAFSLKWTLERGELPAPIHWKDFVGLFQNLAGVIEEDVEMSSFWLPTWRSKFGSDFRMAMSEVAQECLNDIRAIEQILSRADGTFRHMVTAIEADQAHTRGSGTKTSLLASALAWQFRRSNSPEEALIEASNVLECDTDSIATMTGALLGLISSGPPTNPLQDMKYISLEAGRLQILADGGRTKSHRYPDLLRWQPPKTQNDVVSQAGGHLQVEGLGGAEPISPKFSAKSGDAIWQWLRLDFGQTILAKQRGETVELTTKQTPDVQVISMKSRITQVKLSDELQSTLFVPQVTEQKTPTLHELTSAAIRSNFDPKIIGEHILGLTEGDGGIELSIAYIAILAKARLARRDNTGKVTSDSSKG